MTMATLLGFMIDVAAENVAATTIALLVTTYLLVYRWQFVKTHLDEPPVIPSTVPFVGHLLGMALLGGKYVKNLGLRHPDKPIFTLPVPGSRMYIVTDPSLAAAVQRASKTLSFAPLVPDITQRVLGLDDDTVAIVRQRIDAEPGEVKGFIEDMHDLVYSYFGPGESLDGLSLEAVRELAKEVNGYVGALRDSKGGEETVDLLQWIRHFVAIATANLLYGDQNPLALHPELESAFWDFDHGLGSLLMGILPSIIAPKAYRGREALVAALEEYLLQNRHLPSEGRKGASKIVQQRITVALQHGWTLRAVARSELSFLFAGIVNTATTTFWIVLHLFASASSGKNDLLSTIRAELSSSIIPSPETDTLTLSLDKLRTTSPTLQSLFRECLRQNSDTYSTRLVKSATTLPGQAGPYHLATGSVVQISGGTMHSDPRIWGPDVGEFRPFRFLSATSTSAAQQKKRHGQEQKLGFINGSTPTTDSDTTTITDTSTSEITTTTIPNSTTPNSITTPNSTTSRSTTTTTHHPAAFRAFGGGKTLCPGRHFASTSIEAFVALLVTQFDISAASDSDSDDDDDASVDAGAGAGGGGAAAGGKGPQRKGNGKGRDKGRGRGQITVPGKEDGVLPVHVLEPKGVVRVKVGVREGGSGGGGREVRVVA